MNVKVYSAPWCPFCRIAKEWLKTRNIPFEEVDVQESKDAANYIIEKTGQTAIPVIEVDGQFIVGFDEPALKKVFKVE